MIGGRKMRQSKAERSAEERWEWTVVKARNCIILLFDSYPFPGFTLGCFQLVYRFPADY